jgi:hypothetical protein
MIKKITALPLLLLASTTVYPYELREYPNLTGNPIGGGGGYEKIYSSKDVDYIVSTKTELIDALDKSKYGDIIYIDDKSEIDLTGERYLKIKNGVSLVSSRGEGGSKGARIFSKETEKQALFLLYAGGAISGLRIEGPTQRANLPGCFSYEPFAISVVSGNGELNGFALISNNEIYNWPYAGVNVQNKSKASILNNYIHSNRRSEYNNTNCNSSSEVSGAHGLGYGIVVGDAYANIEGNLFRHNRHDIAGTGKGLSSYTARYNVSETGLMSHSFDMHGCQDTPNNVECIDGSDKSGERIIIENNVFLDPMRSVWIRGNPSKFASISNNYFSHEYEGENVIRYNDEQNKNNVKVNDNIYGVYPSHYWKHKEYDFNDFYIDLYADNIPVSVSYSYCGVYNENCWRAVGMTFDPISKRTKVFSRNLGDSAWFSKKSEITGIVVGDFTGNGRDEIAYFGMCNGEECWRVHQFKNSTFNHPMNFKSSFDISSKTKGFGVYSGDFDRDGIDDIIYLGECERKECLKIIKSTGKEFIHYKNINDLHLSSETVYNDVGIYDFNDDGILDVSYFGECRNEYGKMWLYHISSGNDYFATCSQEKIF